MATDPSVMNQLVTAHNAGLTSVTINGNIWLKGTDCWYREQQFAFEPNDGVVYTFTQLGVV